MIAVVLTLSLVLTSFSPTFAAQPATDTMLIRSLEHDLVTATHDFVHPIHVKKDVSAIRKSLAVVTRVAHMNENVYRELVSFLITLMHATRGIQSTQLVQIYRNAYENVTAAFSRLPLETTAADDVQRHLQTIHAYYVLSPEHRATLANMRSRSRNILKWAGISVATLIGIALATWGGYTWWNQDPSNKKADAGKERKTHKSAVAKTPPLKEQPSCASRVKLSDPTEGFLAAALGVAPKTPAPLSAAQTAWAPSATAQGRKKSPHEGPGVKLTTLDGAGQQVAASSTKHAAATTGATQPTGRVSARAGATGEAVPSKDLAENTFTDFTFNFVNGESSKISGTELARLHALAFKQQNNQRMLFGTLAAKQLLQNVYGGNYYSKDKSNKETADIMKKNNTEHPHQDTYYIVEAIKECLRNAIQSGKTVQQELEVLGNSLLCTHENQWDTLLSESRDK